MTEPPDRIGLGGTPWGNTPPAGWYPDPAGSGVLRYWDGGQWTAHLSAPVPGPAVGTYGPSGYGPSGYGPSGYAPRTNGLAIASLVLSLVGVITYGIGFILGVIFGHIALSQIGRAGGAQRGRGLAIAGLVIGYIGVGLLALVLVAALVSPQYGGY